MRTLLMLPLALAVTAVALAGEPVDGKKKDPTLDLLMKPAELIVTAKIAKLDGWASDEIGVIMAHCDLEVTEVLKGTWDTKKPLRVTVERFGFGDAAEAPHVKKGATCVFFLKRLPKGNLPEWSTPNLWIGVQPMNKMLTLSIKESLKPKR